MKLIVGLGNPGQKYHETKHNIGFMTIDQFAKENNLQLDRQKFEGEYIKTNINNEEVIILKPLTFMNDSGRSVAQFAKFFKIDVADILVVQDDLDMPVAKIRIRKGGSAGGHNGIKSIIASLGSQEFTRLKIGIQHPTRDQVVNWVLTPFDAVGRQEIDASIATSQKIILDFINEKTTQELMNKYN